MLYEEVLMSLSSTPASLIWARILFVFSVAFACASPTLAASSVTLNEKVAMSGVARTSPLPETVMTFIAFSLLPI